MFEKIIKQKNNIDEFFKIVSNNSNPIGSILRDDKDIPFEENTFFDRTFLEELRIGISESIEYTFDNIKTPTKGLFINDRKYDEWCEEELYEYAEKSKFGNVIKSETCEDETIRKSRDINSDNFKVDTSTLEAIRDIWNEKMGEKVKVVPYKINIYKSGDFFVKHTDSPDDGLIGTTLIDISKSAGSSFVIENEVWKSYLFNTCTFYSDLLHEVKPTRTIYRVTISFKIYSEGDVLQQELETVSKNVVKFGVLLRHGYSYSDNTVKGIDRRICETFNKLGWKYEFIPVIVGENLLYHDYDETHKYNFPNSLFDDYDFGCNISIYSAPEEIIRDCPPDKWTERIIEWNSSMNLSEMPFIFFSKGYKWNYHLESNIYVGNEHSGVSLKTTYLNKALIVTKQ